MATTTNVAPLKINYLTQAQYDTALANNQINSNELYFTPSTPCDWSEITNKPDFSATYKVKQTAVTTATAGSGTTTTVVSSVTQNEQGVITVTTKSIPTYNNYSHPTGDGNLHVPATSTTNNGKFLKAGSTAGSLSWANVSWSDIASKPLTLTAASTGFTIAGGTTSKTLTVSNSYSLGAACEKAVDTTISASSTSTNLPTSKAVATFVEGKGYVTSSGVTSITIKTTSPLSGGSSTATTSTGTYTLGFENQSANTVLAGPGSGSAAAPAFRALVAADIPDLAASKITSGTLDAARIPSLAASKITSGTFDAARIPTLSITDKTSGTLTVARGGTGVTSFTNDYVIVSTGTTQTLVSRGLKVTGDAGANATLATASGKTLTIESGSTLMVRSASTTSTIFYNGTTEYARFNTNGMFQLNDSGTQNSHKLYVNGDSAFNGKLVFGAQASNVITPKADIEYNSTDESIDFVFT